MSAAFFRLSSICDRCTWRAFQRTHGLRKAIETWRPRSAAFTAQQRSAHSSAEIPSPESKEREQWQTQKAALAEKFGEGWKPRKKLSPDAIEGIKHLHAQDPDHYSTPFLANKFEVSAEAIRRILKSRWMPSETEQGDRRKRWEKRGVSVWQRWEGQGMKAPRKWKELMPKEASATKSRDSPDWDTFYRQKLKTHEATKLGESGQTQRKSKPALEVRESRQRATRRATDNSSFVLKDTTSRNETAIARTQRRGGDLPLSGRIL